MNNNSNSFVIKNNKVDIKKEIFEIILNVLLNLKQGRITKFTLLRRPELLLSTNGYTQNDSDCIIKKCDENEKFQTSFLNSNKSLKSQVMKINVLVTIYTLTANNSTLNLRSLFYQNVNLYQNQYKLNSIINDISFMLNVPRNYLYVTATNKGIVFGQLIIFVENIPFDCSTHIVPIPDYTKISNLETSANYVFLLEKETIFDRLRQKMFFSKHEPIILITARGMPDINTRGFLNTIKDKLSIPILALMDPDPYGIHIYMVYKYGSKSLTHYNSELTCDFLYWLGIHPSDLLRFLIATNSLLPKNIFAKLLNKYTCMFGVIF